MELLAFSILFLVVVQAQAGTPPIINLPADAEVVTIVGNGFRLNVTQLARMQSDWKAVADDLEKEKQEEQNIEGKFVDPEIINDNKFNENESNQNGFFNEGSDGFDSNSQDDVGGEKDYGFLEDDLHTWIEDRATALADRVDRYAEEIGALKQGPRIVSQVLLLNTLYDLENLTKENIKSLKWIKNKLRWIMNVRAGVASEIKNWVSYKIEENVKFEPKVRGKNDPGTRWIMNVQAIKRIMHEQRFSESIKDDIIGYLGGEFNMMERSKVYDMNKPAKLLEDGLYYYRAKDRIPAYFPFFSQDSIINGAQL